MCFHSGILIGDGTVRIWRHVYPPSLGPPSIVTAWAAVPDPILAALLSTPAPVSNTGSGGVSGAMDSEDVSPNKRASSAYGHRGAATGQAALRRALRSSDNLQNNPYGLSPSYGYFSPGFSVSASSWGGYSHYNQSTYRPYAMSTSLGSIASVGSAAELTSAASGSPSTSQRLSVNRGGRSESIDTDSRVSRTSGGTSGTGDKQSQKSDETDFRTPTKEGGGEPTPALSLINPNHYGASAGLNITQKQPGTGSSTRPSFSGYPTPRTRQHLSLSVASTDSQHAPSLGGVGISRISAGMRKGKSGRSVITSWQQQSGRLLAGSRSDPLKVWDVAVEMCVREVCIHDSKGSAQATALGSSLNEDVIHVGLRDGLLLSFDLRLPPTAGLVESTQLDSSSIVHISTQATGHPLVAACRGGVVAMLEPRCSGGSGSAKRMLRNSHISSKQGVSLDEFALHPYAPICVSGSQRALLEVFDFKGTSINHVKHHIGFLGQRLGGVSALEFHKHQLLFAVGYTDPYISLFSGD